MIKKKIKISQSTSKPTSEYEGYGIPKKKKNITVEQFGVDNSTTTPTIVNPTREDMIKYLGRGPLGSNQASASFSSTGVQPKLGISGASNIVIGNPGAYRSIPVTITRDKFNRDGLTPGMKKPIVKKVVGSGGTRSTTPKTTVKPSTTPTTNPNDNYIFNKLNSRSVNSYYADDAPYDKTKVYPKSTSNITKSTKVIQKPVTSTKKKAVSGIKNDNYMLPALVGASAALYPTAKAVQVISDKLAMNKAIRGITRTSPITSTFTSREIVRNNDLPNNVVSWKDAKNTSNEITTRPTRMNEWLKQNNNVPEEKLNNLNPFKQEFKKPIRQKIAVPIKEKIAVPIKEKITPSMKSKITTLIEEKIAPKVKLKTTKLSKPTVKLTSEDIPVFKSRFSNGKMSKLGGIKGKLGRLNSYALPIQLLSMYGEQTAAYKDLVKKYGKAGADAYIKKSQQVTKRTQRMSDEAQRGLTTGFEGLAYGGKIPNKGFGDALSGGLSGAATGASIGSVIPGLGTGIGAIGGALVGGISSWLNAKKAEDAAKSNNNAANIAQLAQQRRADQLYLSQAPANNMVSLYPFGGNLNNPFVDIKSKSNTRNSKFIHNWFKSTYTPYLNAAILSDQENDNGLLNLERTNPALAKLFESNPNIGKPKNSLFNNFPFGGNIGEPTNPIPNNYIINRSTKRKVLPDGTITNHLIPSADTLYYQDNGYWGENLQGRDIPMSLPTDAKGKIDLSLLKKPIPSNNVAIKANGGKLNGKDPITIYYPKKGKGKSKTILPKEQTDLTSIRDEVKLRNERIGNRPDTVLYGVTPPVHVPISKSGANIWNKTRNFTIPIYPDSHISMNDQYAYGMERIGWTKNLADPYPGNMYTEIKANGGEVGNVAIPNSNSTPINNKAEVVTNPDGSTQGSHETGQNVPVVNAQGQQTANVEPGEVIMKRKDGSEYALSKRLGFAQIYQQLNSQIDFIQSSLNGVNDVKKRNTAVREIDKIKRRMEMLPTYQEMTKHRLGIQDSPTKDSGGDLLKTTIDPRKLLPIKPYSTNVTIPKPTSFGENGYLGTSKFGNIANKIGGFVANNIGGGIDSMGGLGTIAQYAMPFLANWQNNRDLNKSAKLINNLKSSPITIRPFDSKVDYSAQTNEVNRGYRDAAAATNNLSNSATAAQIKAELASNRITANNSIIEKASNTSRGIRNENIKNINDLSVTNASRNDELNRFKLENTVGLNNAKIAGRNTAVDNIYGMIKEGNMKESDKTMLELIMKTYDNNGVFTRQLADLAKKFGLVIPESRISK